jgi:hypothetical protein
MRYTRVGMMSYIVMALLLGVAFCVAAWRARPADADPPVAGEPTWVATGREVWAAACAECHPVARDLASAIHADPAASIDLLLRGAARFGVAGAVREHTRHPTFDLSDVALAASLSFAASYGSDSRALVMRPPLVAPEAIASRRPPPPK